MNIVKFAETVQEGLEAYKTKSYGHWFDFKKEFVICYVIKKSNGQYNPNIISMLIDYSEQVSHESEPISEVEKVQQIPNPVASLTGGEA